MSIRVVWANVYIYIYIYTHVYTHVCINKYIYIQEVYKRYTRSI